MNRKSSLLVFLIFISLLVSCSPRISPAQLNVEQVFPLIEGHPVGQTFVADRDGLAGISIYLEPVEEGGAEISLSLWPQPGSGELLGSATLDLDNISAPGFYEFSIEPIPASRHEYYYAELRLAGGGNVNIGTASHAAYINGALYIDTQPQDMQMTFNLYYHPGWSAFEGVKEILSWVKLLVVAFVLFVIPGWGFLSALWSGWGNSTFSDKLILSSGLSIALYPLLLLWLDLPGIQPGSSLAWLPAVTGLVIVFVRNRNTDLKNKLAALRSPKNFPEISILLFLMLTALIIFTRLWSVGLLEVPQWGDSYHHTMISRLIVENGGLFDTWEPYAELDSFTYHFGFHASAAVFHWITGDSMPESVLWVGQVFNILSVLVLFPLANKLAGNRWGGVIAVLFAGLLFPLPMFYVNWGRYTQLAGQVILPVMMYITWEIFEREEVSVRSLAVPAILIAGLSLSHYRVLFFAIFFLFALLIFYLRRKRIRSMLIKFTVIAAGAFILFLPWFLHVYGSTILQIFQAQITTAPAALPESTLEYNTIGELTLYLPAWAWFFLGIAVLVGLLKRLKQTMLVLVWFLLLLVGTNPGWIGLPGTGALSNFALFIAVYIPAALIIGLAVGILIEEILTKNINYRNYIFFGLSTILLILSYIGTTQRLQDVNMNSFALVTHPDRKAASWIEENVPEQATFLVNSFLAYDGTLAVGSDGGLWLPLLAERDTILPPITYGFENGTGADNLQFANNLLKMVYNLGPTHPDVIDLFREQGISHVYIGQRRGGVNFAGETLVPQELLADPHYQPIYHQDLVWIIQITP